MFVPKNDEEAEEAIRNFEIFMENPENTAVLKKLLSEPFEGGAAEIREGKRKALEKIRDIYLHGQRQ